MSRGKRRYSNCKNGRIAEMIRVISSMNIEVVSPALKEPMVVLWVEPLLVIDEIKNRKQLCNSELRLGVRA